MTLKETYSVASPHSAADRLATHVRRKIYDAFLRAASIGPGDTVLDIGVSADKDHEFSNFFEAWYPHKHRITATSIHDASHLELLYPGLRFVSGDGRDLPFEEGAFDFVFSNAVLEHVGSRDQQAAFIAQAARVARKGVFLTTPNRWFPIELHSALPLVHWLPPKQFRAVLRALNKHFLADESNLNLLDSAAIRQLLRKCGLDRSTISYVSLLGWPSNILVYIRK